MSPSDPVQSAQQPGAGKKKKNNKKKNAAKKAAAAEAERVDINEKQDEEEDKEPEQEAPEPTEPTEADEETAEEPETPTINTTHEDNSAGSEPTATTNGHPQTNGHTEDDNAPAEDANAEPRDPQSSLTAAKLEAMSQGREALRVEVEQLRRQLETIQSAHSKEVSQLRSELEESEAAKDHAETQYQTLLTRVEKIKETLGDRLKRDRAELEEAKDRIEELEALNEQSQTDQRNVQEQFARLKEEMAEQEEELSRLRSRSNLSQQNWLKEKEGLESHTRHLKAELESATNAMGEWEVIAMEERSMRENLAEKVADLEEQLVSVREAYQRAAQERDTQSSAIDGLQRALQEIQEARKKELRDMVESSEEQLSALRRQAKEAETRASAAESERENLAKELERTVPFEKEVKEKNLLIGKLRHEAIVLNDHLTKALKYIKKTKPEETIDRQIVTNHFLHFLTLDRSDPRKFQILQVIAGLLEWTDEQREQAGLARPGGASNTLRLPLLSPFHRTPSSPALNTEFFSEPASAGGTTKESLADLWAGFLERSVGEAQAAGNGSRKGSMASVSTHTSGTTKPDT